MDSEISMRQNKAITKFRDNHNCAQAVAMSFSEILNTNEQTLKSFAAGFGGGMGRLQKTCGAVTGAFMALSVYNSNLYENNEAKDLTGEMIRSFHSEFVKLIGSTDCIEILGCDLNTEEGEKYAMDNNLYGTVCENCIRTSVSLVCDLLPI